MTSTSLSDRYRRTLLAVCGVLGALTLSLPALAAPGVAAKGEPVLFGVSGPLTGQNAQYGAQWKAGFDLALEDINANGGVLGRPFAYQFEDSQSDPRQSVAIAQKFVNDPKIVIELGDFSSPASMAASPIYQRAGLVQLGFTNSHPDFTKGGDFVWSPSISQADSQPLLADLAIKTLGLKRVAVLHLNTDWGRTSKDVFVKAAAERGAQVVASEGYLPDEKDFRSTLVRVRDAKPDGIVLISYYADGALIAGQVRNTGITLPLVAVGSVYSPKFIELGADAVNGVYTNTTFFPEEPRAEVQNFVKRFRAKYNREPDAFNAYAYDAVVLAAHAINAAGSTDRKAIRDAFYKIKDVPSIVFGKSTFDPNSRRVIGVRSVDLVVRDGKWAVWDGKKAVATR
jgi:branched-chain amino acid transport system substrate-binding protein